MTTRKDAHAESWIQGVWHFVSGLFGRPEPPHRVDARPSHEPPPHPTEEELDQSLEDSFPASDPPSYSGTSLR